MVDQWIDIRSEEKLNQHVVKDAIKKLEKNLARYNVPPVGHMEEYKEKGRCKTMYNQLNNTSTSTVRKVKMNRVHNLNEKYQVDVNLFAEVGVNCTAGAGNNFARWHSSTTKTWKK